MWQFCSPVTPAGTYSDILLGHTLASCSLGVQVSFHDGWQAGDACLELRYGVMM